MRKVLFWMHLCTGCVAGLVVLIMSVTGVALTYEKQMVRWFDKQALAAQPQGAAPLPAEALLARVREQKGSLPSSVTWRNSPAEPVLLSYGREGQAYADAATGAILGAGNPGARKFFRAMTDWHRWLGQDGPGRTTGRAITGACNLAFLFIVVSGLYLWFPRKWTRRHFAPILWFRGGLSGKARDFNWHNVIGIWSFVPLFVIVLSALPMSFPWANTWTYRIAGDTPPPAGGGRAAAAGPRGEAPGARGAGAAPIEPLWARAEQQVEGWRTIGVRFGGNPAAPLVFTIDRGTGGQPQLRGTLTMDRASGNAVRWETYTDQTPGRQLRTFFRFAHTGEYFGIVGQTVAGLASAGAVVLVWTGLALALRRFGAWRARRAARGVSAPGEPRAA